MWRVDGRPGAAPPADDRGLAYGDGVFETVAVVDGRPALWPDHRARLARGCTRLGFAAPLERVDAEVAALAGQGDGVIKLIVTRGSGGRGYTPPTDAGPRVLARRGGVPERPVHWWREGITVHRCVTALAVQPALAGIKHLNRLEQVLARREWDDPGIAEGLMADTRGNVVAGTMSNVFARFDDILCTPPVADCGIAGVMRRRIIALAPRLGLRPRVRRLTWDGLARADELWLSNSLVGVWPVARLERRAWPEAAGARACIDALAAAGTIITPKGWHSP
ncbi:Aminodeoxychorismate lyase [wastewater metagenome]|uniref:aminodeoxychorismate lyase n=2 Tax=unclassified sequences TaxID=12908 RepID=A0A5B8RCI3_9ZZZZ|nr:aminodeoxychorismate lyase [Arhodomonas sp. KWT]QEA05618.1 aminodeoxychorismate lyase [uncultured organism]